jgi:nucleoside recognition membrane protein YjiH
VTPLCYGAPTVQMTASIRRRCGRQAVCIATGAGVRSKLTMRVSSQTQRLGRFLRCAASVTSICVTILVAGRTTIAPRNALPQAEANRAELDGFSNVRCCGD